MDRARKQILVVDDIVENIDVLFNILKEDYDVLAAKSGYQALKLATKETPPDLILLDVMMPELDGFGVCRILKETFNTKNIPIIFVTAKDDEGDESNGFAIGAVDYITKPVRPSVVLARVKTHLALYDRKRNLEDLVRERTLELEDTRLKIIRKLGKAGEFKDNETGLHVIRMSKYAQLIGRAMGMSDDEAELLLNVVPMHDIGKIGIPDKILLKPGNLNAEEWKIMQTHTTIGADILGMDKSTILKEARVCAMTHHEKWDGSGYPNGLKGTDIPLYGRIAAISDVFDALTSERPYKNAWSVDDTMEMIESEKGKHFQPELVDILKETLPEVQKIKNKYSD